MIARVRKMLLTLLVSILAASAFAGIEDGLIAYYPFNGNANDDSGNGYHGTVSGATLTTDRFGDADAAYHFNGSSDFVELPAAVSSRVVSGNLTISSWISFDSYASGGQLGNAIVWTNGGPRIVLLYQFSALRALFRRDIRTGDLAEYAFVPIIGQTYHIVAVSDDAAKTIMVYIDGEPVARSEFDSQSTMVLPKDPWYVGSSDRFGSTLPHYFHGVIDDVRIYDRALSGAEVKEIFAGQRSRSQWPVPSTQVDAISQNFARFNGYRYAPNHYHTGIDIGTGGQALEVRPILAGRVIFIQENGGKILSDYTFDGSKKGLKRDVGSNCADHGLGNTVIVEHVLEDKTTAYSQYSHLAEIDSELLDRCGSRDPTTFRRVCSGEESAIGLDQTLGTTGGSGYGEADYGDVHLHFELKRAPYLGSHGLTHDEGEWGYTDLDPQISEYLDPLEAIHSAEELRGSFPAIFNASSGILEGPGALGGTEYDLINSTDSYQALQLIAVARANPTDSCPQSWYKVKPAAQEFPTKCGEKKTKDACFSPSIKSAKWETPHGWVCGSSLIIGGQP